METSIAAAPSGKLPDAVLDPGCQRAPLVGGQTVHRLVESDVRFLPVEHAHELRA
jgi:hypothetical protein